jgi:hypothetical protein
LPPAADQCRPRSNSICSLNPVALGWLGDLDGANVGEVEVGPFQVTFRPVYFGRPLPVFPPGRVAAVDHVGPRAEFDVLLDGDDAATAAQNV